MYSKTITLFNYNDIQDEYYPTIIEHVEIQPIYKTNPLKDNTSDETQVLIIIQYKEDLSGIYILSEGNKKYYKKPKSWIGNNEYFTIRNNTDFIIFGNYKDKNISLESINLNELKNKLDDLFMINEVKDFSDDLKHFEILAN